MFFLQLTAGFWKTLNAVGHQYEPTNPASIGMNRVPHNIAFGALYFWLPFAVLLTAYVGGAQTENSVPRILERLRSETDALFNQPGGIVAGANRSQRNTIDGPPGTPRVGNQPLTTAETDAMRPGHFQQIRFGMPQRRNQGGLPIWQPDKFSDRAEQPWGRCLTVAIIIVLIPTFTAESLSYLAPTEGFGCRAATQLGFFGSWCLNLLFDFVLCSFLSSPNERGEINLWRRWWLFWLTFTKDILFTAGSWVMLTYTAIGVFNSCSCWSKFMREPYISFPQEPFVFNLIRSRLANTFPLIVGGSLVLELSIFAIAHLVFSTAHRVLKQRDLEDAISADRSRHLLRRIFRRRTNAEDEFQRPVRSSTSNLEHQPGGYQQGEPCTVHRRNRSVLTFLRRPFRRSQPDIFEMQGTSNLPASPNPSATPDSLNGNVNGVFTSGIREHDYAVPVIPTINARPSDDADRHDTQRLLPGTTF